MTNKYLIKNFILVIGSLFLIDFYFSGNNWYNWIGLIGVIILGLLTGKLSVYEEYIKENVQSSM